MGTPVSGEVLAGPRVLVADFDQTIAQTFEPCPNGVGVKEAYELAIEDVFGLRALDQYLRAGGLHNRASIEVVGGLAPDAGTEEQQALRRRLDGTKLNVLLEQIGSPFPDGSVWPRPVPGYLELKQRLLAAQGDGLPIDEAIVSSGHSPFIDRTFEVWGVPKPANVTSCEIIGALAALEPPERLVKPSPLLMDFTLEVWRARLRRFQAINLSASESPDDTLKRVIYVGDDPVKDGQLAQNSGVEFVLIDPDDPRSSWGRVEQWLGLDQVVRQEVSIDA